MIQIRLKPFCMHFLYWEGRLDSFDVIWGHKMKDKMISSDGIGNKKRRFGKFYRKKTCSGQIDMTWIMNII